MKEDTSMTRVYVKKYETIALLILKYAGLAVSLNAHAHAYVNNQGINRYYQACWQIRSLNNYNCLKDHETISRNFKIWFTFILGEPLFVRILRCSR